VPTNTSAKSNNDMINKHKNGANRFPFNTPKVHLHENS